MTTVIVVNLSRWIELPGCSNTLSAVVAGSWLGALLSLFRFDKLKLLVRIVASVCVVILSLLASDVHFRFFLLQGQDLNGRAHFSEAASALQRARTWSRSASASQQAELQHVLGVTFQQLGRFNEALSELRASTKQNPKNAKAQYHLGNLLREMKQPNEAESAYQAAIAADDDFVAAWNNLGVVQAEQGKIDEAIKTLQRAIRIDAGFLESHNQLGKIFLSYRKDLGAARRHFLAVLKRNVDHFEGNYYLAVALDEENDLAGARKHYEQALRGQPGFVLAIYNLGNVYRRLKETKKALEQFRKVLNIDPGHPTASAASAAIRELTTSP